MKDTFLFKFISIFILPFTLVGIAVLFFTTLYSLAIWDFSSYSLVIDFFSPIKHVWVRVLYEFWAVASALIVINIDPHIKFFK